jgi:hypothetical protein
VDSQLNWPHTTYITPQAKRPSAARVHEFLMRTKDIFTLQGALKQRPPTNEVAGGLSNHIVEWC